MIKLSELNKRYYHSGEVAKMVGLSQRTIQNYCNQGKFEFITTGRTNRLINKNSVIKFLKEKDILLEDVNNRKDIIYARVSTHKQNNRGDLQRQIDIIEKYVIYQNPQNLEIIKDIGSGLNDSRKGLLKLISMIQKDLVNRIFITYKDRLTRFGFNYIKSICDNHNVEIIEVSNEVVDKSESEELAEDIITIIHSFSGKLYGMRKRIKETLEKDLGCD